jgi:hypothetical protein
VVPGGARPDGAIIGEKAPLSGPPAIEELEVAGRLAPAATA